MTTPRQDRLDALKATIRARGLRATPARVSVLDAIRTADVPLSLADVARRLSRNKLDRATIFRNLTTLTRTRLVRRIDPGDRIWRFVLEDDTSSWRADFVCLACGSMQVLEDVELVVGMSGAPRVIAKREIELHVHGFCDRCT